MGSKCNVYYCSMNITTAVMLQPVHIYADGHLRKRWREGEGSRINDLSASQH